MAVSHAVFSAAFLGIGLLLSVVEGDGSCNVVASSRIDCYPGPGSSQGGCLAKGCCWVPAGEGSSIPWCFKKSGDSSATLPPKISNPKCHNIDDSIKTDCFPELGASESSCQSRNCCWQPSSTQGTPWCFFPGNDNIGYKVDKIAKDGSMATLSQINDTHWPNDVKSLKLNVFKETSERLHFKIVDAFNTRFEVPIKTPPTSNDGEANANYGVTIDQTSGGITVTRKSTGTKLFDSTVSPMIYADQYIQITTSLPTTHIYGLGEHRGPILQDATSHIVKGFWARDQPPYEHVNLYGSHPLYLGIEADGNAFGVYLLNANAMEIVINPGTPPTLTYRTIGGILDFYVFTGPTPNDVIRQYTDVIGKPMLPPYWSLGYHNCRWGWGGSSGLREVIKRLRDNGVPFDTTWADIDYMDEHRDWTVGNAFSELPDIVKDLHDHGQKFVPIVDPAISNKAGYIDYEEGIADDIFIKNQDDSVLIGKVWPGDTAFPDFTHPKAYDWWYKSASRFHAKVPFDGIWIDMNEPANFVAGSNAGCSTSSLDKPPFTPSIGGRNILEKTLCGSAKQHLGTHYNLHNMYGHFEGIATNKVLTKLLNKRPFVLSRSTFPSSGQYVAHWEGDNNADWHSLQLSIPEILNFNMFGIPFVGADICGFQGRTTDELCTRWMQLGTFYPFMRNHRDIRGPHQDPMSPEFSSTTHANLKKTLLVRYHMLPFFYTAFYESHMTGHGVVRPLFFKYPTDSNTLAIDDQFMWTDSLLVSPVTHQGKTTVEAYMPADRWFDLYSGKETVGTGAKVVLQAPMDTINVHIRGGSIIPMQTPDVTTTKSRVNDFGLAVAPSSSNVASGRLYWDDGDALDALSGSKYNLIDFKLAGNKLTFTVTKSGYVTKMTLGALSINGVASNPTKIMLDGTRVPHAYDSVNKVVRLERLSVDLLKPHTITWS
ncbi:hypothetical protein LOTGIDRAFT_219759 [Lottia gigantea]|uniref:P-type domain-containing protein n=1 Tax=Lottia gigantea TaxID=225164 RepID=V3ZU33_LOTGI|nr:hypothetical protein LOTGIDRAFT_219759 [Lottia gigantea]ESO87857.1 hypothetical protein LOTGIDRAFT_219759 [Lottia gigantea]